LFAPLAVLTARHWSAVEEAVFAGIRPFPGL